MYIAIIAEAVFARKAKGGWGKGFRVYTVATKNNKNGRDGHFCFFRAITLIVIAIAGH